MNSPGSVGAQRETESRSGRSPPEIIQFNRRRVLLHKKSDLILNGLTTLTRNTVRVGEHITFEQISWPIDHYQRALDLLDVTPRL